MTIRRSVFSVLVFVAAAVFGFVLLLRGCLSKYDERSGLSPVLYFEQPGSEVIFSIVKFEKTTSYSQKNGMTSRSVAVSYFIQTNDAVTGEKKLSKKIKKHRQVKQYPVEVMGRTKQWAWVFVGEPMAFDPFTLEKKADLETLETQNPALKGKLPAERKYYRFDRASETIYITATDGTLWKMNATGVKAEPTEETEETDPVKKEIERINELEKENQAGADTLYQQKNRRAVEQYSRREISAEAYQRISKSFYAERTLLSKERDSLQKQKRKLNHEADNIRDEYRKIEQLNSSSQSFSSIKYNADTVNGKWFGLYAREEEKDMKNDYFDYRSQYKETARRQFCYANYTAIDEGRRIKISDVQQGKDYFLDGGFLVSKTNARPLKIGNQYLVVHKDRVGNEGQIIVSLVSQTGNIQWNCNTGLKNWADWLVTAKKLVVTGADNKKLSSGEINVLLIIDLASGKTAKYDYFTDK